MDEKGKVFMICNYECHYILLTNITMINYEQILYNDLYNDKFV